MLGAGDQYYIVVTYRQLVPCILQYHISYHFDL